MIFKDIRFEVINHCESGKEEKGRVFVKYAVDIEISMQDDNKTMKIFVTDDEKVN